MESTILKTCNDHTSVKLNDKNWVTFVHMGPQICTMSGWGEGGGGHDQRLRHLIE